MNDITPDSSADRAVPAIQCVRCDYDLRGLDRNAVCPECGEPVETSITGTLLRFAEPRYLAILQRGAGLVLAGIILGLLGDIGARVIPVAVPDVSPFVTIAFGVVSLIGGVCGIVGWWKLSTLDPMYRGKDTGGAARRFVRATVLIQAVALASIPVLLGLLLLDLIDVSDDASATTVGFLLIGAATAILVARVVQFFAAMVYLKWLGRRVPSRRIVNRARTLMWAGPLLFTVGLLIIIGPLIALVLYYNMISWLRTDLKSLRAAQSPAL